MTLAELKAQIASYLHRSDLTTQIAEAITDAIAEYQGRRFAFNQARDTFATTAGTEYYGSSVIPTDIAEVDSLKLTYAGVTYTLEPVSFSWMDDSSSNTSSRGRPTKWAWYGQEIRLYPVPDAAYTLSIAYLQKIDAPADGASNAWTTTAAELIRNAAVKRVSGLFVRDYETAEAARVAEERQWRRLLRESHQLDTGRIAGSM